MNINIKGKSETLYPFEMYPISQEFRAVGAVYAILKFDPQPTMPQWYRYIYIGETGDLSTRFSNHHKQSCFDRYGADWIAVHPDSSEESRTSKEADILAGGSWPCND